MVNKSDPSSRHGHSAKTPDVSHIENVDVTHELSDVNVFAILRFVVGLTVLTAVVYFLMLLLFNFLNSRKEPPPGPMALSEQERLPPEPRLQSAPGFGVRLENGQWVNLQNQKPQAEYRLIREEWEQELNGGTRDQSGKIVSLPVDEAMQKVLQSNALPTRSPEASGGDVNGYAESPPTAASSGRVPEKRSEGR